MGEVVLVGAGPGDRKLVTVAGKKYIEEADCIIYDRLIGSDILQWAKSDCRLIYVGKENHKHTLSQDKINELLLEAAGEHKLVVRLKGGDPYVFGRGGEEAIFLNEHNIKVSVVPGISSSIAALSYAGIPITHRGLSKGFRVITAHSKADMLTNIDFSVLTDDEETLVFLMGLSHIDEICSRLLAAGRKVDTPVAVISNGTLPCQTVCVGTLQNICAKTIEKGIMSPAIIVVGKVVSLSEKLSYYMTLPLFGKKYFIPRIIGGSFSFKTGWTEIRDTRLEDMLGDLGAQTRVFDMGKVIPKRIELSILDELGREDYLVFTSQNAVHSFMWNLCESGTDIRSIGGCKIAVVGHKTKEAFNSFGIAPDIVSTKKTAAGLADVMLEYINDHTKLVWFKATDANMTFYNKLHDRCILKMLDCYTNEEINSEYTEKETIMDYDGILFTCGSNVKRTIKIFTRELPAKLYSIGPSCSNEIKKAGIYNYYEAKEPSYEELVRVLVNI